MAERRPAASAPVAFGFGESNWTVADFTEEGSFVRLAEPRRVDLLTSISGVSGEETRAHRVRATLGDTAVSFMGGREFIVNKRASGRAGEFPDIQALREKYGAKTADKALQATPATASAACGRLRAGSCALERERQ